MISETICCFYELSAGVVVKELHSMGLLGPHSRTYLLIYLKP